MIERLVPVREGLALGILEWSDGDAQAAAVSVKATLDKAWTRRVATGLLDLGAVGYPLFWMFPARSSGVGSTGAAKESPAWLAVPSTAALVVGLALSHGLVARRLYRRRETS